MCEECADIVKGQLLVSFVEPIQQLGPLERARSPTELYLLKTYQFFENPLFDRAQVRWTKNVENKPYLFNVLELATSRLAKIIICKRVNSVCM
jgi:hypothetical protein